MSDKIIVLFVSFQIRINSICIVLRVIASSAPNGSSINKIASHWLKHVLIELFVSFLQKVLLDIFLHAHLAQLVLYNKRMYHFGSALSFFHFKPNSTFSLIVSHGKSAACLLKYDATISIRLNYLLITDY